MLTYITHFMITKIFKTKFSDNTALFYSSADVFFIFQSQLTYNILHTKVLGVQHSS